jgi:hypothetical protein
MRVILLILFILLIGQIIVNFFFIIKRVNKYDLSFIKDLHNKMIEKYNFILPEIFKEFEELFEKYVQKEDGREITFGQFLGQMIISFFIMGATDVFLIIGVLLQTCRDCMKICRGVSSLILLSFCIVIAILCLVESIITKYKLDLPDSQIYLYDIEFNKKIKEKLNMMVERKIYMLAFSIFLTLAVLTQYVLIIIDIHLFKKKNNNTNINNNTQPQIAVNQESERELNRQNNGNADIQVHIRQNILNTEDIPVKNN